MFSRRKYLLPFLFYIILQGCNDYVVGDRIPSFTEYTKTEGVDYLEFISIGDTGTGFVEQYNVASAMGQYVSDNTSEFVVMLGDNFYPSGVSSVDDPLWISKFEDVYDESVLSIPFYVILGNHDYRNNIQAQLDYVSPENDRWQMPGRYYSRTEILPDSTRIDLFFLDTNTLAAGDTEQLAWLDAGLSASSARWIIVAGHHPVFSNGLHGDNPYLEEVLKPLLDNRADLYISGHEHDLQILKPVEGVFYIIDGSGGQSRSTGVEDNTIMAAGQSGFMVFLISRNDFVCRVYDQYYNLLYSIVLKTKL